MPIVADGAVAIRGDLTPFYRDLKKGQGAVGKFGKTIDAALSPANLIRGLAGGYAIAKVTEFFGAAIESASNLNETMSKTGQVFGDEAMPGLEAWAKTASTAFGQSERQALDAASAFGIFGKAAGLTGQNLTGFSTQLTELASDLASFSNTSVEDATTAISAALRGESEPIRKYGVLLNEATLRQRALALGIIKTTTDALTPQQRVLAAQAEILAQTSDAQGDFARTSDQLANTQRTNAAKMEDAMAKMGAALLPVATQLATFAGDVIPQLADGFNLLVKVIGPVVDGFRTLGEAFQVPEIGALPKDIEALAKQFGVSTDEIIRKVKENMSATGASFHDATETVAKELGDREQREKESVAASGEAWDTYQSQIAVAGGKAVDNVRGFQGTILEAMEQGRIHVVEVALRTPGDIADALEAGRSAVAMAAQDLKDAMEGEIDPIDEIAALQGQLAGQDLADGLKSKDPIVRLRAQELYQTIQDRLSQLGAYAWGSAIAKAWADGVASRWGYAHAKAVYLGTALSGPLEGYSPPREGPLKDIDKWGANIGQAWADGLDAGAMSARLLNGLTTPSMPAMAGSVGGGTVNGGDTYIVQVEGKSKEVGSGSELYRAFEQLTGFSAGY